MIDLFGPTRPVACTKLPHSLRALKRLPFSQSSSYDLLADMEEPNNDIDTETLQAQIDLAMAQAQNLIASWLPGGSSGSLTQSSSSRTAEAEAELQALLRRPPRYVAPPSLLYFAVPETVFSVLRPQAGRRCTSPGNSCPRAGASRAEATRGQKTRRPRDGKRCACRREEERGWG